MRRTPAPAPPGGTRQTALTSRPGSMMLRFVGRFVVASVVLFGAYWTSEVMNQFDSVNVLNAVLSGAVLNAVGIDNTRSGRILSFQGGGMEIISECSGVYIAILFTAGVLAFPATWRARWRGLAFGLVAIFGINIVRLVTLGMVIAYKATLLPFFHEYLWQVFFILIVAMLYFLWIERMVVRERLDPAP